MVDSPFIELLAKHSAVRLREMLAQYDADMARITFERNYVERALALKGASTEPEGQPAHATPRTPARPRIAKGHRPADGKRDAIRQIMETRPDAVWLPSEIRDAMIDAGSDASAGSVRAVMKRMLDDGELERPAEGAHGFKLADTEPRLPGISANGAGNGPDAPLPVEIGARGGQAAA